VEAPPAIGEALGVSAGAVAAGAVAPGAVAVGAVAAGAVAPGTALDRPGAGGGSNVAGALAAGGTAGVLGADILVGMASAGGRSCGAVVP
jgi:hypothetical protein